MHSIVLCFTVLLSFAPLCAYASTITLWLQYFLPCHCRWVTNQHHHHRRPEREGKVYQLFVQAHSFSDRFPGTTFLLDSFCPPQSLLRSVARAVVKPSSGRTCEIRNKIILIPFPAAFKLNLALHVNHRSVAGSVL